jgi:hypothetical protein
MGYQGLTRLRFHPCNGVIMGHPMDDVLVGAGPAFQTTLVGLQLA